MNSKTRPPQGPPAKGATAPADAKPPAPTPPAVAPVPPLFRRIDWLTLGITFAIVWVIYYVCLAPEVTLEDSGELCTASYYAGIPHPPGYPFWTIYTWLWTVLVPFKNIAWRVALAEASTAAMAAGVLGFMVSRGSSMLLEGIEELKNMTGKWEGAICMVCGVTAGLMMGLGSSMWKESVVINRISLFGVPWMMLVLVCLMRWNYAPHQRRYLYIAFFFLGICSTIHQTLTMAVMGIEIGVAFRDAKLGRDLFLLNSVCYLIGLAAKAGHVAGFFDNTTYMVFAIYNGVGLASLAACCYLTIKTSGLATEWKAILYIGLLSFCGASFYFYEAISGMTNPPMEWGYPRTVGGFWHALSRGQYDKVSPTDVFHDPVHFLMELKMLVTGLADAFSWVGMFFALLPFLFIFKMKKRERSWIIIVSAIYPFLGVLLAITLNPTRERQTADLVKVFFTASHAVVAILIGYGLALTAAFMATNYQRFRRWGLAGAGAGVALALYSLVDVTAKHYRGLDGEISLGELPHLIAQSFAPNQYGLPIIASILLLGMTLVFLGAVLLYRQRAPLAAALGLFAMMPVYSGLAHWFHSEQHNHWFGYWFGHDMFTPPFVGPDGKLTYDANLRDAAAKGPQGAMVYPEMARDAVLYGGTDPGRFCPTYTIFCESFIPHDCQPEQDQHYDRRDVYIITQNALADNTYLDYIRAQYNRSAQIDPPFFQRFLCDSLPSIFKRPFRAFAFLDDIFEGLGAKVEKRRRAGTSWFTPEQITNPHSLAAKLRKSAGQDALAQYLYGKLNPDTQHLVDSGGDDSALRQALSKDLNAVVAGPNLYDAERFKNIKLPVLIERAAAGGNLLSNNVIRLNRRMLEEAYPDDIVKSLGGVYPDTEILTASPDDSGQCFQEYMYDAQRRLQHDMQFPNEPHQVRSGEDVHLDESGRVQISGQVAVMAINGLLTKVIFDKNPDHEFYVEESFPLDWMYPHLVPFGIIMKINRQPVAELSEEVIAKDHAFWSQYSQRTIGNWITYDTSIKQICDWAEKVYLRHDFSDFKGDPAFIRDDDGQKAFSKLRSSIGSSIYLWRSRPANSRSASERVRVTREAEFALKQAVAYCPYSPEAVFHLMDLLLNQGRVDDAIAILETCHSLDPYNGQISDWIDQLTRNRPSAGAPASSQLTQVFSQIDHAIDDHQTNAALQALQQLLAAAGSDPGVLMQAANAYLKLGDLEKSEAALQKLAEVLPSSSEPLYNLAVIQTARGKITEAIASLQKSLVVNARELAKNPKAMNLRQHLFEDPPFAGLRQTPQFQSAFGSKP